jgi:hypothetical protein
VTDGNEDETETADTADRTMAECDVDYLSTKGVGNQF